MNIKTIVLPIFAALAFSLPVSAADKPSDDTHAADHGHAKKEAGPNGGRVLTTLEPHAEFFVTPDRKVQITFLGEDDKPVAPAGQVVTVTAGDRSAPTKLTFTQSGNVLISDVALPAGNDFPTVVQIKTSGGSTVTDKFNLNMSECPTCENAEYACICDH